MQMPHEVRRALGTHHHSPTMAALMFDELRQQRLVLGRCEVRQTRPPSGGDEEVQVERNGTLLRGPVDETGDLVAIPSMRRGLDDEVEAACVQSREGIDGRGAGSRAMPEVVVVPIIQRIDAHREASHPSVLQRGDPFVGEEGAIGSDDDRRAASRGVRRDRAEIITEEGLAAGEDEHRRRVERKNFVGDSLTLGGRQLARGGLTRACRDVAVGTFKIATPREIPGDHVRHVVVGRPNSGGSLQVRERGYPTAIRP